uniref:Rubicon like autophagy enhancer n=1 Tax=Stegastes partitus TaxID=144197 RepID=A0A3B4ZUZ5_9TELE
MCTKSRTSSAQETRKLIRKTYKPARSSSVWDAERENSKRRRPDEERKTDEAEHPVKTFSVLSTDSGFEGKKIFCFLTRKRWYLDVACLSVLPGNGGVAVSGGSLTEEIRLRTRMRGSLNWAPPRFQIIFSVQPTHRRSEVVASQHFLCAGCGTEVEPSEFTKLRYCEYLGRYFCDCCHSGSEAVIPGRVLSCWDFGRCSVSDFSKQLLDSVWNQPLFDLNCVGKTLYGRVKELDRFRELQEQLLGIKKLLKTCRFSGSVLAEFGQLPAHLLEKLHLFSMDDLFRVKKGQLLLQARNLLHSAIDHVENCQLCLARGFICEFCREKDVIFPFQTDTCKRCAGERTTPIALKDQKLNKMYFQTEASVRQDYYYSRKWADICLSRLWKPSCTHDATSKLLPLYVSS